MKPPVSILSLFLGLSALAYAQHRTAPNGYYPVCYAGDVWTGTLSAVDDDKREISLTDADPKHNGTETFVGVIKEGYTVSRRGGPPHELKPSELPLGKQLSVYYCMERKKVNGKKTTVNEVFLIDNVTNLTKGYSEFKAFR
jgi:hypothetical protein